MPTNCETVICAPRIGCLPKKRTLAPQPVLRGYLTGSSPRESIQTIVAAAFPSPTPTHDNVFGPPSLAPSQRPRIGPFRSTRFVGMVIPDFGIEYPHRPPASTGTALCRCSDSRSENLHCARNPRWPTLENPRSANSSLV